MTIAPLVPEPISGTLQSVPCTATYGLTIEAESHSRDFVTRISRRASGNVIIDIGRELGADGNGCDRYKTAAYIVLTPDETAQFVADLTAAIDVPVVY